MKQFIRSLNGKILLVIFLVVIPAAGLIYLNSLNERNNQRERQLAQAGTEVGMYVTTLNTSFGLLEDLLVNLALNNESIHRVSAYENGKGTESLDYWRAVRGVYSQVKSVQSINNYVENIFIYYPKQQLFFNSGVNAQLTQLILQEVEKEDFKPSKAWQTTKTSQGRYLYRVYAYGSYYVGAWISCDALLTHLGADNASDANALFFMDANKEVLNSKEILIKVGLEDNSFANMQQPQPIQAEGYTLVSEQTLHPGIYVVKALSDQVMQLADRNVTVNLLITCVFIALIILAVIIGIYRWVLVPMQRLVTGIEKIGDGDITHRLENNIGNSSEFIQIGTKFNSMMDQLAHMRIQIYEQELLQQETWLRYLSQQIQPHFILNSLNTLYTYSKRDVDTTRKLIRLLSEYYRYVVNVESKYVSLSQELEHIGKYLDLQKIRFPRTLNYQIKCESSLKIVPVPPFFLESFVGNALKHGMDTDDMVWIIIEVVQVEAFVIKITISDTGTGFPGEVLEALKRYQNEGIVDEDMGVGIRNCIERLRLIYHEKAAIAFYNRQPHGAVVEIMIHLQQEEK